MKDINTMIWFLSGSKSPLCIRETKIKQCHCPAWTCPQGMSTRAREAKGLVPLAEDDVTKELVARALRLIVALSVVLGKPRQLGVAGVS